MKSANCLKAAGDRNTFSGINGSGGDGGDGGRWSGPVSIISFCIMQVFPTTLEQLRLPIHESLFFPSRDFLSLMGVCLLFWYVLFFLRKEVIT